MVVASKVGRFIRTGPRCYEALSLHTSKSSAKRIDASQRALTGPRTCAVAPFSSTSSAAAPRAHVPLAAVCPARRRLQRSTGSAGYGIAWNRFPRIAVITCPASSTSVHPGGMDRAQRAAAAMLVLMLVGHKQERGDQRSRRDDCPGELRRTPMLYLAGALAEPGHRLVDMVQGGRPRQRGFTPNLKRTFACPSRPELAPPVMKAAVFQRRLPVPSAGSRAARARPGPGVLPRGVHRPGVLRLGILRPGVLRPGVPRPSVLRPGVLRRGSGDEFPCARGPPSE